VGFVVCVEEPGWHFAAKIQETATKIVQYSIAFYRFDLQANGRDQGQNNSTVIFASDCTIFELSHITPGTNGKSGDCRFRLAVVPSASLPTWA
jgi:hypothetical protein